MTQPSSRVCWGEASPMWVSRPSAWRGLRCRLDCEGLLHPGMKWGSCVRCSGPIPGSSFPAFARPGNRWAIRCARSTPPKRSGVGRPTWLSVARLPRPATRPQRTLAWWKHSIEGINQPMRWAFPLLLLPAVLGAQATLSAAADRAKLAWAAHDPEALVGKSSNIVLQIPGADPSSPLGRAQAIELLRRYLRPA